MVRERLLADLDLATDPTQKDTTMTSRSTPADTATADDIATTAASAAIRTSLSPYLIVGDGRAAVAFYATAFGAVLTMSIDQPDGRLGHAELEIDGATFSLADEFPEYALVGPNTLGNSPVTLDLVVADVDTVVERAVEAGASVSRPVAEQFYGARSGQIVDPFGHRWTISTPGDEVSPEEMQRRNDEIHRDGAPDNG